MAVPLLQYDLVGAFVFFFFSRLKNTDMKLGLIYGAFKVDVSHYQCCFWPDNWEKKNIFNIYY